MSKIVISRTAAMFIRQETAYLRRVNPSASRTFLECVKRLKKLLSEQPMAGMESSVPGLLGSRRCIIDFYVFTYDVGPPVVVHDVRHGRQIAVLVLPDEPDPELR
jgi:plasmid stabilization system protein ParE